jgi:hypothetical protein
MVVTIIVVPTPRVLVDDEMDSSGIAVLIANMPAVAIVVTDNRG